MSMGYRGKTTNAGREVTAVQAQMERESQWGEMPGTVVEFDAAKQTIKVKPDYRPMHNGEPVDMPELEEVPVRFPRAGGFSITAPIKPGDKVTLRPQMRSTEEFHTGNPMEAKSDTRSSSLSDMEAFLEGGEPLTNPIPNFNGSNFQIRSESGDFAMEMSEDGKFKMQGATGNWFDIMAELAEKCEEGFTLLGTEATLDHMAEYAALGTQIGTLAAKLRGMVL